MNKDTPLMNVPNWEGHLPFLVRLNHNTKAKPGDGVMTAIAVHENGHDVHCAWVGGMGNVTGRVHHVNTLVTYG